MTRYIIAGLAIGGCVALAPVAAADPLPAGCTKDRGTATCTTTDDPSNHWTTDTSQKGSFESSHPTDSTVTNPGGNEPPGKQ